MKDRRILITLFLILLLCSILFSYNYVTGKDEVKNITPNNKIIEIVSSLHLPYVDIYLYDNGKSYLIPITNDEIAKLDGGNNLKDRLTTLYNDSLNLEVKIEDKKVKGYEVKVDDKIENIYNVTINDKSYIIFLKENDKIALFDYDSYYNLMYTNVLDNYNNIIDVLKIEDDNLIYLDGTTIKLDAILK